MTKPCAVPKCRTGYKSEKKKYSVFRVPKDIVRLKKWEETIPGNIKLQANHVICEKHFDERYIRREWIKFDSNDKSKIIARAPYKYPQLSELAVPTRFNENLKDERAVDSIMEYLDTSSLSSSIDTCSKIVRIPLKYLAPLSSIGNAEIAKLDIAISDNVEYVAPFVDDISMNGSLPLDNGEMSPAMEFGAGGYIDAMNLVAECASPVEQSPGENNVANDGLLTSDKGKINLSMEIPHENLPINSSSTLLDTNAKPYSISTVTISEKIQKENSSVATEYSTEIPNSWSATELRVQKGQRITFQYIVTKIDNGVQIPVLQKCVALNSNRKLEYFVYGRRVETQETILDQTLGEVASLRKTLQVFERMGICAGLGITNNDVPIEDAYVDYVQEWRHNNCTLISKQKRCAWCMKLRNRVNVRIRHVKTRPTLKRIHQKVLNAFDHRTISALLKRTTHERRSRKKAEGRVNSLTNQLQGAREKIAHIEDATLQKRVPR